METYPNTIYNKGNLQLLPTLERTEPIVQDHSSIIVAEACLRKYFYRIVLGRVSRSSNMQLIFDFGSAYHKFREVLEKTGSIKEAFLVIQKAKLAIVEENNKFSYLTKDRLMKACMIAYDYAEKEKRGGKIEVLHTEAPFNVQLPGSDIYIGGRADQIIRWNGKIWGRDFKTTTKEINYFSRGLKPNDQFLRYFVGESLLHAPNSDTRIEGIIVEVMQNLKTGSKIHTVVIQPTTYQTETWIEEQKWFNENVLAKARESDRWMMQPHNCSWCDYHIICQQPNERAMEYKLKTDYIYQPWQYDHVEQGE